MNSREAIFATNTSSLSVTEIGDKISNPERLIGMHFFNPAPVMKLVEVVRTDKTSPEVVQAIVSLSKQLDKTPVVCKDSPGFIVNRVARPFYIEALRLVEEGKIDFETIDNLLESTGFKMGPFKLMDLIGTDVRAATATYTLLDGEPTRILHHGQPVTVSPGDPAVLPIAAAPAASPPPTQPPGREPTRRLSMEAADNPPGG